MASRNYGYVRVRTGRGMLINVRQKEVEAIANPVMRDMYGRANQNGGGGDFEDDDEFEKETSE